MSVHVLTDCQTSWQIQTGRETSRCLITGQRTNANNIITILVKRKRPSKTMESQYTLISQSESLVYECLYECVCMKAEIVNYNSQFYALTYITNVNL